MPINADYPVFRFQSDFIVSYSTNDEIYIRLLKRLDDCGAIAGKTEWFFPKNIFPPYKISLIENFGRKVVITITSPTTIGQKGFPKELESILNAFGFEMILEKK